MRQEKGNMCAVKTHKHTQIHAHTVTYIKDMWQDNSWQNVNINIVIMDNM